MRIRLISALFFLLAVCVFTSAGFAWNSTGHKVVALVAWEDLTPKTKAAITAILKQHPRYEKDLLQDAPADETPDEQARTAFATAATWPDMVRSPANPMSFSHNHPAWHYIDIPYAVGHQKVVEQPANGDGPHNLVEALTQCAAELKDPKISDADKAVDICWVEHLVGDIHQPLHSVSMYSPQYPDGDKGGNAEMAVRERGFGGGDNGTNLHSIWDSLGGNFQAEGMMRTEATGLRADHSLSRHKLAELLKVTDYMAWAKESNKLAIENVYLEGKLETVPVRRRGEGRGDGPSTQPMTPVLPPGYISNAETLAMHQLTLAGYRLADQLNSIFDPKDADGK